CEKPLATTIEDADAILTAAARNRARLYVGHNMRHMPAMRTMKDIIDSGRIGEVKAVWCRHFVGHGGDYYFKDWHADRRKSTGLL
ncbi:gfo/Idh/MocA family oxidoreductase, partial [Burkholderia multivorans]